MSPSACAGFVFLRWLLYICYQKKQLCSVVTAASTSSKPAVHASRCSSALDVQSLRVSQGPQLLCELVSCLSLWSSTSRFRAEVCNLRPLTQQADVLSTRWVQPSSVCSWTSLQAPQTTFSVNSPPSFPPPGPPLHRLKPKVCPLLPAAVCVQASSS